MNSLLKNLPTLAQIEQERARRRLNIFTQKTKPDYKANWHHLILCQYLERWAFGDIDRLMVFMPPRNGKSELVSRRLPAWILGRDPDASIIATSYGADLASRMNRDVQRIIDSPEYAEIFPETTLNGENARTTGNYLRNSDIFEIVGHKGVYKSAGVGGAITGMGMKYGIIDDPVKNRQDANSATKRQTVWDWYTSTFYTRLEPGEEGKSGGKILITLTRWHEDDLAGRLIEQDKGPDAENWTILNFPAIATDNPHPDDPRKPGEPLWPAKYPLKTLNRIKKTLGPIEWGALHQQNPQPQEGALLKRHYWQYYTEHQDPRQFELLLQSWDCTFKDLDSSDYVVGQVWGKKGPDVYLLDQTRAKMGITETMNAIKTMSAKWPQAHGKYIEDKANGPAVIELLKNQISGLNPVNPKGGKIDRAQAALPLIAAGNVYLPSPEIAPWVDEFVNEAAVFPNGKHDDQVDAATQGILKATEAPAFFIGRA